MDHAWTMRRDWESLDSVKFSPTCTRECFPQKTSFENVFSQGKVFVKLFNLSQDVLDELHALLN